MARVPRHFHFIFGLRPQTEPFHVVYYLCLESCLRVNRPERLTLYYLHEPHGPWWERIRDRIERVRVDLSPALDESAYGVSWERHYRYAHHADFIRLEKLIEHGGVYADIDFLFLRPLPDEWFEEGGCGLGRERPVPQPGGGPQSSRSAPAVQSKIFRPPNFWRRSGGPGRGSLSAISATLLETSAGWRR